MGTATCLKLLACFGEFEFADFQRMPGRRSNDSEGRHFGILGHRPLFVQARAGQVFPANYRGRQWYALASYSPLAVREAHRGLHSADHDNWQANFIRTPHF